MTHAYNLLKSGLLMAALAVCFACTNNDAEEILENEEYEFQGIEWACMDEEDIVSEPFSYTVEKEAAWNGEAYSVHIEELNGSNYDHKSQFFHEDEALFSQLAPYFPEYVSVPQGPYRNHNDFFRYQSDREKAPISLEPYSYHYTRDSQTTSTAVPFKMKATIQGTKYEVTYTYRITLKGKTSGELKELTGLWKGTSYKATNITKYTVIQ